MFILFAVCCFASLQVHAQTTAPAADTIRKVQRPPLVIKPRAPKPIIHEWSAGLRINTNGWSIYTDLGKAKTKNIKQVDMFHNVRFYQLEFTEKKDPKEQKITLDDGFGNQTKYIYGKINNFYALKLGLGYRKMLAGKPEPGTVSIHWSNVIGGSLGLLKPYYLNVVSDPSAIHYSDATRADFLNQQYIAGSAGFSKGLGELTFIPGGHFKSALHFDFAANKKNVLGVETGVNAEFYSSPIALLANQAPSSYFVDLFIAVQFGKRW